MPRTGEIGEQIFADVEKLVAEGKNRTEAFALISAQTGRQAGTVAANYYRVARKRAGGSLRKPKATTTAKPSSAKSKSTKTSAPKRRYTRRATVTGAGSSGADIDALAADLITSVNALATAIKAQDHEVKALRERLDGVKALLG